MNEFTFAKTGHSGLDLTIDHLRLGDNVVWQIDSIEDYMYYAQAFAKKSIEDGKKVVYFRFTSHEELLKDDKNITKYVLDPAIGFEDFTITIHSIIQNEGVLTFFIFDCLTSLLDYWASDLMISHFFAVTSKYLYKLDDISYFAVIRNRHSYSSISEMRSSTQVLFDLYNMNNTIYIVPLKVEDRYSKTMFSPHLKSGIDMIPLTSSSDTSHLFSTLSNQSRYFGGGNLDNWDRMLIEAADLVSIKNPSKEIEINKATMFEKLLQLVIGKEEKMLKLAREHFNLKDLNEIGSRLISSGHIGGKAAGMLIARKILLNSDKEKWENILESHDSYYIGSDVFYAYIIDNDLWDLYKKHRRKEYFFEAAKELKERFLNGCFPEEIKEKIIRVLQYYGQSPIIIRSSSLLEDSYNNAFAGKYESYFLVNQGTLEQRYIEFEQAMRKIYASAMSYDALTYRKIRGLEEKSEQMSLFVQRVSGDHFGNHFFPFIAGVGLSQNTYTWDKGMEKSAGLIRLVFGLGTRAVDRLENDYSRIMALDYPKKQMIYGDGDVKQFSQHFADILDTQSNKLVSLDVSELIKSYTNSNISLLAEPDLEANRLTKELGIADKQYWILTYNNLIDKTEFINYMKDMLSTLQKEYDHPIELEFTANSSDGNEISINLLQCRPIQTKGIKKSESIPKNIAKEKICLRSDGNFMGGNIYQNIDRIISIDPEGYSNLHETEKYQVARIIGKLTNISTSQSDMTIMAIGPGRWGSTSVSLGIPVSFSEIANISILCEREFEIGGMSPELSYGSHFFHDLVEENIFYIALFSENGNDIYNSKLLGKYKNALLDLLPDESKYESVVKVIDSSNIRIIGNIEANQVVCYEFS